MDSPLSIFSSPVRALRKLLYPACCHSCHDIIDDHASLCVACLQTISPLATITYPLGAHKNLSVFAVGDYKDALKNLIHKKFTSDDQAARILGELIAQHFPLTSTRPDFFVPVPLHWKRYAQRGYNQAVEMARTAGKKQAIKTIPLLIRKKKTAFQSQLSCQDRAENIHQAFHLHPWFARNPERFRGKTIVLVDDLCTTGATLVACAKALGPLNPKAIIALVAARAT